MDQIMDGGNGRNMNGMEWNGMDEDQLEVHDLHQPDLADVVDEVAQRQTGG